MSGSGFDLDPPINPDERSGDFIEYKPENRDLNILAREIQNSLALYGLFDTDSINTDTLAQIDIDILNKLTPQTAESLFIDTWSYSRKFFGLTPVKFSYLIRQAKSYRNERQTDLEQLQQHQIEESVRMLQWLKVNPGQILQLLTASPDKKQSITRLSFVFFYARDELLEIRKELNEEGSEDKPWSVEEIALRAQVGINTALDKLENAKKKNSKLTNPNERWTFIQDLANELKRHKLECVLNIIEKILDTMRDTTFEQFMAQTEDPFES